MTSSVPLRLIVVLILALGLSAEVGYAQIPDDPCPDPNGRCPGDVDAGDVISSVIFGGLVAGLSKAVTGGQLSGGRDAAVGLRVQRGFPIHGGNTFFVGMGLQTVPESGASTSNAAWDVNDTQPHFEVSNGYIFRPGEQAGRPEWLRRLSVGLELNLLLGAADQVQVAIAPRYDFLSDNRRTLFLGLYVRQQVLGRRVSPGPSVGISVGISRFGGR